jgi:hypothetical protein
LGFQPSFQVVEAQTNRQLPDVVFGPGKATEIHVKPKHTRRMASVGFMCYLPRVPPPSEKGGPLFPIFSSRLGLSHPNPIQNPQRAPPAASHPRPVEQRTGAAGRDSTPTSCLLQPPPGPDESPLQVVDDCMQGRLG